MNEIKGPQSKLHSGGKHRTVSKDATEIGRIVQALTYYPYYCVVHLGTSPQDQDLFLELAKGVAEFGVSKDTLPPSQKKVSFTRVRIDKDQANAEDSVTRYSRTHKALSPHTDSSYMTEPHELVAFHCLVADTAGGETSMVPLDDIMRNLDKDAFDALREPVFAFGDRHHAVLNGEGPSPSIRYYDAQLQRSIDESGSSLSARHRDALSRLDMVLNSPDLGQRFSLASGEVLFMNNTKVLHGRSGFSKDSERLLHRVRLRAPGLKTSTQMTAANENDSQEATTKDSSQTASDTLDHKLVRSLAKSGRIDDAILICTNYLAGSPRDGEAHVVLAKLHEKAGRIDDAVASFTRACEVDPSNAFTFELLGDLLLTNGRFDEAKSAYQKCLQLDPDNYYAGLSLSSIYREDGDMKQARAILGDVVRKHPFERWNKSRKDRQTILRMRGFQSATYGIIRDTKGEFVSLLQGGHFSIQHLLNHRDYNLLIANIFEDNINKIENLPDFQLILNTISCADREPASLLSLARFVDRHSDRPVINHPRQVYQTTRDRNYQRLASVDGVIFPQTERIRWEGGDAQTIVDQVSGFGFEYPLIVRAAGSQTGLSVKRVKSEDQLIKYFSKASPDTDYYIIQYHDHPRGPGLYNKTRIFCIDGHYHPVANLFVDDWAIHSGDRYAIMDKTPWTQEEERAYLEDHVTYLGTRAYNTLLKLRDIVDLDFFGIDFTLLPDGNIFIFELNPAMRHNYDHADNFPYTRPHLDRITQAFNDMVRKRVA